MKSEHRHELAENDLEKVLNRGLDKIEPHSNRILIGFLIAAVAVVGIIVFTRTSGASRAAGWTQLAEAGTPDEAATVADENPGSNLWGWAKLRAAQGWLMEGLQRSLNDREASNSRIEEARKAYDEILQNSSVPAQVREQALYGTALALETTSDGKTEDAVAAYEQLIREFPESRLRKLAEDRIEALQSGGVQEFYAWFHAQNPKPEDRPLPRDGEFPAGLDGAGSSDLPLFGVDGPSGSRSTIDPATGLDTNPRPPAVPLPEAKAAAPFPPGDAGGAAPGGETPATPAAETPAEAPAKPAADAPTAPAAEAPKDGPASEAPQDGADSTKESSPESGTPVPEK